MRYHFRDISNYTQSQKSGHKILGIVVLILFYLILIHAYYSSYTKHKIGWNTPQNNKYNLISTAFRWTDRKPQTIIIILFLITLNTLLYLKNFFKPELRIVVPIMSLIISVCAIALIYVIPERFILHNTLGVILIFCGVGIALYIKYVYQQKFVDQDIVDITQISNILYISVGITLIVGIFNITNNYILKKNYFIKYNPLIRNTLGVGEVISYILMGIVIYYISLYPPLP